MSFSSTVKNELCRFENKNECCILSEIASVVRINGLILTSQSSGVRIRLTTENAAFARKFFTYIKRIFGVYPEVTIRRSQKLKKHVLYILDITSLSGAKEILQKAGIEVKDSGEIYYIDYLEYIKKCFRKSCCKKAYLRGAFLSSGSVSDPEKTYHLEILSHKYKLAEEIGYVVNSFQLHSKIIKRKSNFVVYLKEGENIVDFLNIVGAHKALMELENIRILKDMRNSVNRIVNCETANLEKTVEASFRQIENIKYIIEKLGLDNIPENLQEIAELRLSYSDANLKELGEMMMPMLGKSGVNHRLRKLDRMAEDLKALKGDI